MSLLPVQKEINIYFASLFLPVWQRGKEHLWRTHIETGGERERERDFPLFAFPPAAASPLRFSVGEKRRRREKEEEGEV